ncbi:MAG: alkaline phosphatase [Polynucleobacter sp.]
MIRINPAKALPRCFNAIILAAFLLVSFGVNAQSNSSRPKNIIILFADGTTASQYEFGRYASEKLRQESFAITDIMMSKGYSQLMSTESANYFVTDSAAAASAMSTGYEVNNGAISVTPNGERPETLLKFAKANKKRIGLVSTAPIYDASPAAFSVHAKNRRESELIVNQYLDLSPDILMGGGSDFFLPKSERGGKRSDGKNVIELFKNNGYQYISKPNELTLIQSPKLLGLFATEDIDFEIDRNPIDTPNLAQMLSAALKALSLPSKSSSINSGFVLFAENENTDSAGHQNDVAALMRDLWAFDDAVKVALEFQKKNPDTLVIVTGDHETGGFSPTYGRKNLGPAGPNNYLNVGQSELRQIASIKMSLKEFSEKFKAKSNAGASAVELDAYLTLLLQDNFPGIELDADLRKTILAQSQLGANYNYLPSNILAQAIARQTGFYWATSGHTPAPITVAAFGPGSQLFRGYEPNTQFSNKLKKLIQAR